MDHPVYYIFRILRPCSLSRHRPTNGMPHPTCCAEYFLAASLTCRDACKVEGKVTTLCLSRGCCALKSFSRVTRSPISSREAAKYTYSVRVSLSRVLHWSFSTTKSEFLSRCTMLQGASYLPASCYVTLNRNRQCAELYSGI